jgi:CheY-like chemotaxis protein/GAF domain-containing protein
MTAAPDFFATPATVGTPAARILVVDDEPITSTMCAKALEQVGYSVTATTDVTTALSFLHSGNPLDLLLTDIQMPGMSGIDLARTAREIDPALAVIIMTGHANETTLRAAARSGVADFLSKPFELEELRIAVDQALHKRELQQEQIRLRAYEQLLASSSAINGILDDEQLSHVIVQRARIHVPCAAGFLLSYGPDQTLRVVAHAPPEADLLTAGHTMANVVAQQGGRAVTAPEPLAQLPDLPLHHGLAVPLTVQGRPLGALLLCADHPGLLSVVNQEIVTLLANQSGTALQNARLYGDMQRGYHSLAELDRLKSEFIAITSHELRSPLAIVLGYTKMVRDLSSGDQRDYAQRVLESAQQIRTIVEQLSDLRDYDRNRADLVFTPQALHPLLHIVVERLRPAAALKGQQITMHMPPDDLIIHADHEKLLRSNLAVIRARSR